MFDYAYVYGDQPSRYTLVVYEDGGPKVAHLSVSGVFFERAAQFSRPKDSDVWQLVIIPSEDLTLTCVHLALKLIHGEAISEQLLEDSAIQLGIFKLALAWGSIFLANLTVDKVAAASGPELVDLFDTLVKYQQNLGFEHKFYNLFRLLQQSVRDLISTQPVDAFFSNKFNCCELATLVELFQIKKFKSTVESPFDEFSLFLALCNWISCRADLNADDIRELVIKNVRFFCFQIQHLDAATPYLAQFLRPDELDSILDAVHKKCVARLPRGFCNKTRVFGNSVQKAMCRCHS